MHKHQLAITNLAITLFIVMGLIGGCTYLNEKAGIPDDHFLEEMTEEVIKQETGIVLDLSPVSDESN